VPDLNPGANAATKTLTVTLNTEPFQGYFNIRADVSIDGWVYWSDLMRVNVSTGVADKNEGLPVVFALEQNYPNPFNPATTIAFHLPASSFVTLKVFNTAGQEIASLVDRQLPAGDHRTEWNASGVPSGIYFYRIQAGIYSETKKLVVLK
jgi:hypothetical protein